MHTLQPVGGANRQNVFCLMSVSQTYRVTLWSSVMRTSVLELLQWSSCDEVPCHSPLLPLPRPPPSSPPSLHIKWHANTQTQSHAFLEPFLPALWLSGLFWNPIPVLLTHLHRSVLQPLLFTAQMHTHTTTQQHTHRRFCQQSSPVSWLGSGGKVDKNPGTYGIKISVQSQRSHLKAEPISWLYSRWANERTPLKWITTNHD